MTDRELFEKALEALDLLARCEHPLTKIQVRKPRDGGSIVTVYPHQVATDAAEPLRERLAQPERVQLTVKDFVTTVGGIEDAVGTPTYWAEWPNKE
jgi:hypothetical protein